MNHFIRPIASGPAIAAVFVFFLLSACGGSGEKTDKAKFAPPPRQAPMTLEEAEKDWRNNKGVGPVSSVTLGEIDPAMVKSGSEVFEINCTACHEPYKEKIGPALVGVTGRRRPEWIMNMIVNPVEMAKTDPICVGLLARYNTVMADQGITEAQARDILEYFRTLRLEDAQ
jgi:cytochrome c